MAKSKPKPRNGHLAGGNGNGSGHGHDLPTPRRKDGLLTTGDMARLSRNTLRTVRFYEQEGLLEPEDRSEGGHRLFPARELRKLLLVSDLRAAGLTLDEIRDLLAVKIEQRTGAAASRAVIARLDEQVKMLSSRVDVLQRLAKDLAGARKHLSECECAKCHNPRAFPGNCQSCDNVRKHGSVPDALSVLWRIDP